MFRLAAMSMVALAGRRRVAVAAMTVGPAGGRVTCSAEGWNAPKTSLPAATPTG